MNKIESAQTFLDKTSLAPYIILGLLATALVAIPKCSNELQPVYKSHISVKEQKFVEVFKAHGSAHPVEMAIAVCKTKKPALMAALAIRESNGNPNAVGDNQKAKGAFQVWPSYHGSVSNTASEQALQAERILEDLVQSSRGSLRQGLSRYNTGKANSRTGKRYAKYVMTLSMRVKNKKG
jgi:hypothetical protein